MSVLENFKNIPRSPYGGRQGSNVIFFSSNLQRNSWRKKKKEGGLSPPPHGRQAPVAPPGATGQWARQGGRSPLLRATGGSCRPSHGRPGQPAYIRPPPHSLLSFDLKKSKKIQKKERVRRREAAKLCRIPHL